MFFCAYFKSFIVLCFTYIWKMVCVDFCIMYEVRIDVHFSGHMDICVTTIFLKTLFFLHWIAFWFWSWPKINVWVYFWTCYFATLSDMCIFSSLAYSIIALFKKVLKSRRSFIQICLGPSSISAFQNKIQNKLVSIFKIYVYFAGILIRMEIYISQFGKRLTQHAIF